MDRDAYGDFIIIAGAAGMQSTAYNAYNKMRYEGIEPASERVALYGMRVRAICCRSIDHAFSFHIRTYFLHGKLTAHEIHRISNRLLMVELKGGGLVFFLRLAFLKITAV